MMIIIMNYGELMLFAACDDGRIRVWSIPENGLTESLTQPDFELKGHKDKVTLLKFHPSAKDILASASQDLSILIWDLDQHVSVYELEGHTDQIFRFAETTLYYKQL